MINRTLSDNRRMKIGKAIRAARRAKGWSQAALGEHFGITKSAVSLWESDKNIPDPEKLAELSRILELDPAVLIGARVLETLPVHNPVIYPIRSPRPFATEPEPLIVYAAVLGGNMQETVIDKAKKDGTTDRPEILRHSHDAFAYEHQDDFMVPKYHKGDLIIVDPSSQTRPGNFCFFVKAGPEAPVVGIARHLLRDTALGWEVRQYGFRPRDYELLRADWPKAWLIVGSYDRRQ